MVMSPELRRPPVRCLETSSGLCGVLRVVFVLYTVALDRSVGLIGRNVLIGIVRSLLPAAYLSPLAIALYLTSTTFSYQPATDCLRSPASSRRPSSAH